jgi:two-component system sensor kinase FixL
MGLTLPDNPAGRALAGLRAGTGEVDVQLPSGVRALLEAAPDPLVLTDQHGRIVFMNEQAQRLFRSQGEELLGQPMERLVPKLVGVRCDGSEFAAELSLSPLETEGGLLALTAIRETPDQGWSVEERTRLTEAQEAVRSRDEFLTIAAHELRTPLTALQLQLDGLDQTLRALDPEAPGHARALGRVEKAARNAARITDLVNTLMDLSHIMSERLRLTLELADLAGVVRDVADDFCDSEQATQLVTVDAPERLEAVCDRFRVEQILTNLLSNATKYGQGRPIEVTLTGDAQSVELAVRDHGLGIEPEDRERIFGKFQRADAARRFSGIGLGLYISRYLAEAHGGSITVAHTDGEGAKFVLQIPRHPLANSGGQR